MTSIESTQDLGVVASTFQGDETDLPKDIQKDLQDLETVLTQLKENPALAHDKSFQEKMLDYLNRYVEGYTVDAFQGTLTPAQQKELSDLNEDLSVKGLIKAYYNGTISNPNSPSTIQAVMENLLKSGDGVDWIKIINDAIEKVLGKTSK